MQPTQLGPYRIEKLLGRGGMGAVYMGRHVEKNELAAIKVLSPGLAGDDSFRERFTAEIESLKTLRHPNIVSLYGWGEDDGQLFYAMQYVEGGTLQQQLDAGRPFTWREVTRFGIEICRALKHAHAHGIIHRDLKPANLLLGADGQVMLSDFGIAKLFGLGSMTMAGGAIGTAEYMPPEQAEGLPVTPRCDLYALGCVLYALLTRKPPFTGRSLPEVILKLRQEAPIPVGRLAPDTPDELERIIMQLLSKNAADRIPTANVVGNRLEAMDKGLTLKASATNIPAEPAPPAADDFELRLPEQSDPTAPTGVHRLETNRHETTPGKRPESDSNTERGSPASQIAQYSAAKQPAAINPAAPNPAWHQAPTASPPAEADPSIVGQAAAPRPTRFVTIEEEARQRQAAQTEAPPRGAWVWLALAGVVLLAIVALAQISHTPSADELYAQITKRNVRGEPQPALREKMEQFLQEYPDDNRAGEVSSLLTALQLLEYEQGLESRRGALASASPIERQYLQAKELAGIQPEQALEQLQAILDLYGQPPASGDVATQRCLSLVRQRHKSLSDELKKQTAVEIIALEKQMKSFDELYQTDPVSARRAYAGILKLYGDKPWAKPYVDRARNFLSP